MTLLRLTACTFSMLLLTTVTLAQAANSPATDDATEQVRKAHKELESKALALLDESINETRALKLAENRIHLETNAAAALWPHDKERARALFNAAKDEMAAFMGSIETDDPQYYNLVQWAAQLRGATMQTIAQYDPKLALDFMHATPQPPPPPQYGQYQQPDPEVQLETSLAQQIAAQDPQQALRMAEEVLSKGFSSNLTSVLEQMRQKDPEAATKLAGEIISKLRTAKFASDYEATNLTSYILQVTRPPVENNQPNIAELPDPRHIKVDEQSRRDLINTFLTTTLTTTATHAPQGNAYNLLSSLQQLMPEIEKYAPAQAAVVKRRFDEYEQQTNPQAKMWRQYQDVMQHGTLDALLEAAAKAPPEMRGQLYQTAAWKAFNETGAERARQIISDDIENAQQRAQLLKEFDQQLFWRVAQQGNIEQARELLSHVKSTDERVSMLINLSRLASSNKPEVARQLLEEAWNLVGGRSRNPQQFNEQLQIAQAYTSFAPTRAFEIIEADIDQLNELIAAAAILDGFGQNSFENDELKVFSGYNWTGMLQQCGEELAALSHTDFDRARSDADRFQRNEARLLVRVAVVRGALAEPETKSGNRMYSHRVTLSVGRGGSQ